MQGDMTPTGLAATRAEAEQLGSVLTDLENRSDLLSAALTRAFAQGVTGAKSFEAILAGLAQKLSSLALDAALKPAEHALSSALGSLFSGLSGAGAGGAGGAPGTTRFADGGVVSAPTFFRDAGGNPGLMGEAGAEAILPLKRGADGALGVAVQGGGPAGPSIVFHVQTPDVEGFRRSEAQLSAMLARAARRGSRHL